MYRVGGVFGLTQNFAVKDDYSIAADYGIVRAQGEHLVTLALGE